MRILVIGSKGQLGSEIIDLSSDYKRFTFFFKDLPELDICNQNQLDFFLDKNKIETVINCAAYTAVDKAEKDEILAQKVNSKGVSNLINSLKKVNGKLIHISTDYVFNGKSLIPYKECDNIDPLGVYGKTKRMGELEIINSDIEAIIIRTSWLYSLHGKNFLNTMLNLGTEKKMINVVSDQIGTPTYAKDLAKTCLDILYFNKVIPINKYGKIYHFSNEGKASWYDFATEIMKLSGISCEIMPLSTDQYVTLAKRPQYSVLDKSKIKKDFGIKIPYWKDSLANCIKKNKKK